MNRFIKRAGTLVLIWALAGSLSACFPETKTWLSDPAASPPDTRLLGRFASGSNERETHYLVVTALKGPDGKASAEMRIVWTMVRPEEKEQAVVWATYKAWPARLPGGLTFLNMKLEHRGAHAQDAPAAFFLRYIVKSDGSIAVRFPRFERWRSAVTSGRVEGQVIKQKYLDRIILTAKRADLIRFIAANVETVFEPQPVLWRRVD